MKKEKKGEMSTTFVVGSILLVLGTSILIYFIWQFAFNNKIDSEICHESIVIRGTASSASEILQGYVPLKCKESKYCITTSSKGSCEDFKGEKPQNVIVKNKEQIEQFIAKEMVNCWEMTGRGKLNIFSQYFAKNYGFGEIYPSCILCSRIAYDSKSLTSAKINLNDVNLLQYMGTHAYPGQKVSYLKYMVGDNAKFSLPVDFTSYQLNDKQEFVLTKIGTATNDVAEAGVTLPDSNKPLAIMFMQISAPLKMDVLKNDLKAFTIGGLGLASIGTYAFGAKFITGTAGAAFSTAGLAVAGVLAFGFFTFQGLGIYANQDIAAGYCGDISSTSSGAREGCSVVRTVNYDVNEISKYCSVMESVP